MIRTTIAALAAIASSVIIATNVAPSNADSGCQVVSTASRTESGWAMVDGRVKYASRAIVATTTRCQGGLSTSIDLGPWQARTTGPR
jgi:hypothetical protein